MSNWNSAFTKIVPKLSCYLDELQRAEIELLGASTPPKKPGVYILYDHRGDLSYVGEAKGQKGLWNRRNNHITGGDGHKTPKVYKEQFPDREERQEFIKKNIGFQWVETEDAHTAQALERILILILNPPWNSL